MYQVDYNSEHDGHEPAIPSPGHVPTVAPTGTPTSRPSTFLESENGTYTVSPPLETLVPVVRYGMVFDRGNGDYTAEVCPVVAGRYEIHVLLQARGISNQPFSIIDKTKSMSQGTGLGSYTGQYVDQSPYGLVVSHTTASAFTSTAIGR
jgi:hypothetical protein